MSYDIFTGLLKMNTMFDDGSDVNLEYNFDHPSLKIINEKYNLTTIAGDGDDLSKAFNLLHWVSNHFMHSGNSRARESDIINLMEYAFDKSTEYGINCAMLSHVLSGCLMSVGLYAREVKMIPCSPYDFDSHRVVQVYINNLKKWIMIDPTYTGYVMDKDRNYLNLLDIRKLLAEREEIHFNEEFNYNGQQWDLDSYREYLAKNSFCLCTPSLMTFDKIKFDGFVYICPENFNIKQRDIHCLEYKMNKSGYNMSDYIETAKNDKYQRISAETLIKNLK